MPSYQIKARLLATLPANYGFEDDVENIASPFSSTKIVASTQKRRKTSVQTCALANVTNDDDDDEGLFLPSPAKLNKTATPKKSGFDLGLQAEKILELDDSNGQRMFLIKWFNSACYDYGKLTFF